MLKSLSDLKMYLVAAPLLSSSVMGEELLPGSDSTCCKLNIDKRGRKSTEADVLY